ncbi:MAG: hypothetical protein MUF71_08895 [Candidatus Kapabacteria bacterium]|jgi:hypothetical protein|nr:hypothetical protein [Candidatus Kapabacteria bacterium]
MITTSKQHPEDPIHTIACSEATDFATIGEHLFDVLVEFESFRTWVEREPTRTSDKFLLVINAEQGNISVSGYYTEEADYNGRKWQMTVELPNLLKASQNQASSTKSAKEFFEEEMRKALPVLAEWCIDFWENETSTGIEYEFFDRFVIYSTFDAAGKPEQLFSSLHDGTHTKIGLFA